MKIQTLSKYIDKKGHVVEETEKIITLIDGNLILCLEDVKRAYPNIVRVVIDIAM